MSNDAYCSPIGKAGLQTVFVEIEDAKGTLQRPTASGIILPAGQVTLTQTPTFTDSDELSTSLNVTDQFKDTVPPAEISIPMLARLSTSTAPQGNALIKALMGVEQAPSAVTAALVADIDADDASLDIDGVTGGDLPPVGVVTIGAEKILYMTLTKHASVAGQWTLGSCTRGYAGTTAATAVADATVTLSCRAWMQDVCRPSVSVWLKSDHTVFFAEGATVTAATVPLSNTGGQHIDFTLQAKRMGWCGTATVSGATGGVVTLSGRGAYAYSVGALLQNQTKGDSNSNAGYTVTAVDTSTGKITVSPSPIGWAEDDVLKPWLPAGTGTGDAQAASSVRVYIGNATGIPVAEERQSGTINIGTPTNFATPIGVEYPSDNVDTTRDISIDSGLFFRRTDVEKIGLGYKGEESPVIITVGDSVGKKLAYAFPRIKFSTPEPSTDGEFMTLTQKGKALGVPGLRDRESALYIVQV